MLNKMNKLLKYQLISKQLMKYSFSDRSDFCQKKIKPAEYWVIFILALVCCVLVITATIFYP